MSEKDTIAAQVSYDSSLHERFEEYEEDMRFESRSEAVRMLLRAGLDEYEKEQEEHRAEARTSTGAEEWLQDRARSWAGLGVLSSVGFVLMFGLFTVNRFGLTLLPDWPISLAMFVSLFTFLMFTGGAVLAVVALRTGLVRQIVQKTAAKTEVDA